MKKLLIPIVISLLGIVGVGILLKNTPGKLLETKTQKGISLTPLSFEQDNFLSFFEKSKEAGTLVSWAGDWQELKNPKSAPFVVTGLAKQYGYTPLIIVSAETKDKEGYVATLANFAGGFKPKYLGLGNELNYTFRNNPSEVDTFANTFSEAYDAIKKKSPGTKVFTVFQYETPKNALEMAQKFTKADIVVFTTYPQIASVTNPSSITPSYYSEIDRINKPIAFSEIGWSGTNQEDQAKFVVKFFDATKDLNPEFIIWPFLYDQKATKPFESMGLFDSQGNPRKAWEDWKKQ